ncbi:MAG: hypothetical protein Kow0074_24770 [Candidatus Zixiibacteriota bacterium]
MIRKTGYSMIRLLVAVVLTIGIGTPVQAEKLIIDIRDIEPGAIQSAAFKVEDRGTVHITAVGAERGGSEAMFAYPWIIEAASRELVWSMDEEFTDAVDDSKWLRRFDDQIKLGPGVYEVYYYASQPYVLSGFNFGTWDFGDGKDNEKLNRDLEDLLNALGEWMKSAKHATVNKGELRDLVRQLRVEIRSDDKVSTVSMGTGRLTPDIDLTHPDNDAYLSQAFALDKPTELEIYAIGEFYSSEDIMVDWGWIIDAKSRDPVWEMTRHNTDWAGGATKNRRFIGRKKFQPGEYIVYYVTDDSHTYGDWNAPPPFDPDGYGLQVFVKSPDKAGAIRKIEDTYEADAIVRLTRIGDNELVSEAFRVESETDLRVYAIGEYDRFNDRMADYAWITRAGERRKFWVMDGSNTQPAGGDRKNRRFDGILTFDPGDYVVYYSSDGSHSYGDGWNASPPFDQKSYGVSIYPADPDAGVAAIRVEHVNQVNPNVLAEIVGVHDDEHRSVPFSLSTPTRVSIYAIGEGTRSGMVDYGWIENARTGDIVWEMTYRKTSHAGGADKNRSVDQTIILDKGDYVLHYVTDDSHATGDWNADPPSNPEMWGISLSRVDRTGE